MEMGVVVGGGAMVGSLGAFKIIGFICCRWVPSSWFLLLAIGSMLNLMRLHINQSG